MSMEKIDNEIIILQQVKDYLEQCLDPKLKCEIQTVHTQDNEDELPKYAKLVVYGRKIHFNNSRDYLKTIHMAGYIEFVNVGETIKMETTVQDEYINSVGSFEDMLADIDDKLKMHQKTQDESLVNKYEREKAIDAFEEVVSAVNAAKNGLWEIDPEKYEMFRYKMELVDDFIEKAIEKFCEITFEVDETTKDISVIFDTEIFAAEDETADAVIGTSESFSAEIDDCGRMHIYFLYPGIWK